MFIPLYDLFSTLNILAENPIDVNSFKQIVQHIKRKIGKNIDMEFREWLDKKMKERGWSQADLVRHAKISKGTISMIMDENKNYTPGPSVCTAIASTLRMDPETVFRLAGLLPPKPDFSPELEKIYYLLATELTPDEVELVSSTVDKIMEIKERRENYATPGTATAET